MTRPGEDSSELSSIVDISRRGEFEAAIVEGPAVLMLMAEPTPPDCSCATEDLNTSTPEISSSASVSRTKRLDRWPGMGSRRRSDLSSIEQDGIELRLKATNRDKRAFTAGAIDRHAGDSLQ